eukprot:275879-Pyramimonas_sp.AAC.1
MHAPRADTISQTRPTVAQHWPHLASAAARVDVASGLPGFASHDFVTVRISLAPCAIAAPQL